MCQFKATIARVVYCGGTRLTPSMFKSGLDLLCEFHLLGLSFFFLFLFSFYPFFSSFIRSILFCFPCIVLYPLLLIGMFPLYVPLSESACIDFLPFLLPPEFSSVRGMSYKNLVSLGLHYAILRNERWILLPCERREEINTCKVRPITISHLHPDWHIFVLTLNW